MAEKYEKFLKGSKEVKWRGDVPSFTYILTSSGWRQEHNGFSHQNPAFISGILESSGSFARVYFPSDANSMLVVLEKCLKSKNGINVIVAGKTFEPLWISLEAAKKELERGLMIWEFASDKKPDIVFAAVGDYLTKESLAAVSLIKKELPKVRVRFVSIAELTSLGIGNKDSSFSDFDNYFTKDKPVIFNYHGYPTDLNSLLLKQDNPKRFFVHGYTEHGSTTTPFDMHVRNETSRFHLVIEAVDELMKRGVVSRGEGLGVINHCKRKLTDHGKYIRRHGIDPEEISGWKWS